MTRILFSALITALFLFVANSAFAQDRGVYTVSKLQVDVQAKDAVTAKNEALASAKRQALATVIKRVAPFNSAAKIPDVKVNVIDDMLEGIAVQRERNSKTRYIATLDFTFNPDTVKRLLADKGIPLSDQQGDPITVIPIYISGGKIDHSGRDPWRSAWLGLDLSHAIVPVKLSRVGPSLTVEGLSGLLGGDPKDFVALRDKVKAQKLVLAIAEATADGKTLTSRLYGFDQIGSLGLTRHDPVVGADLGPSAVHAASVALDVIAGRWKLVHAPGTGEGGSAETLGVEMFVEFSSMGQWNDIRTRLAKVPGVNGLDVKSLSARSAQIGLQYPGGIERLAQTLGSEGMSLQQADNGAWVLRSF